MSFTVRLGADLIAVEAGATLPLTVEIANRSDELDEFEISVEGVDPEWIAVPVPTFKADARDVHEERIFVKPPRVSESLAGNYPFVVRVRSLLSGEDRSAQGVISIKPYDHLSMELNPKKGVLSPWRKENLFQATLMNLGNSEHTVQLSGADTEDTLAFEFSADSVTIGPGHTRVVDFSVKPTQNRPISSARLHGFAVSARSVSSPSVMCSGQAQLEQRALLSPGSLTLLLLFVLLFVGWFVLLPKPPIMESVALDKYEPLAGETVTVSWRSSHAQGVRVLLDGRVLTEAGEANGSLTFVAKEPGTVEVIAFRENKLSIPLQRSFSVNQPEPVAPPTIEAFDIAPKELAYGQSFIAQYRVGESVVKASISPPGLDLDLNLDQVKLTADVLGEIQYTLVAENSAGVVTRRSVKVSVREVSDAAIVLFKVEPMTVPQGGGQVLVTWQVSEGARQELQVGTMTLELEGPQGSRPMFLESRTDITLIAYDRKGRTVSKTLQVNVEPPPPASEGSGGTGGGSG
ncbi:MAG: hypothetical protein QY327_10930 [Fimbriimonadaceae bacterium]|nr:MAG: hypothetical protein EDM74_00960 [Armatimonadota bacterium]KXK10200.1 MAG: Ubp3 associated protein Bre5 [Armatimonadetes bacterium OLB18]MBV6491163.1 hypothetical protein [Fimbriimonadaceae bacterium]QOJ11768.1 MAG: hypothetical protein HRU74_06780 [Chthonomonadaceae bacterium]MCL4285306.1 hypothetical protein [Fimbriimonadaceae bacterium]